MEGVVGMIHFGKSLKFYRWIFNTVQFVGFLFKILDIDANKVLKSS